ELPARIRGEAIADSPQQRRLPTQSRGETVRHAIDRLAKPGAAGDRAFQGVGCAVKRRVEIRLRDIEPFLACDPEETLLPGHPLGVESASKVEEKNARPPDRCRHPACPEPTALFSSPISSRSEVSLAWCPSSTSPGATHRSSRPRRTRPHATPIEAGSPRSAKTPVRMLSAVPTRAGTKRNRLFRSMASASAAQAVSSPRPLGRPKSKKYAPSKPPHHPRKHHPAAAKKCGRLCM